MSAAWKTRDLRARLTALDAVFVRQTGSHEQWRLPNGHVVTVVGNRSNASKMEVAGIERALRRFGLSLRAAPVARADGRRSNGGDNGKTAARAAASTIGARVERDGEQIVIALRGLRGGARLRWAVGAALMSAGVPAANGKAPRYSVEAGRAEWRSVRCGLLDALYVGCKEHAGRRCGPEHVRDCLWDPAPPSADSSSEATIRLSFTEPLDAPIVGWQRPRGGAEVRRETVTARGVTSAEQHVRSAATRLGVPSDVIRRRRRCIVELLQSARASGAWRKPAPGRAGNLRRVAEIVSKEFPHAPVSYFTVRAVSQELSRQRGRAATDRVSALLLRGLSLRLAFERAGIAYSAAKAAVYRGQEHPHPVKSALSADLILSHLCDGCLAGRHGTTRPAVTHRRRRLRARGHAVKRVTRAQCSVCQAEVK